VIDGNGHDPARRAIRVGTANHHPGWWHGPAPGDDGADADLALRRARTHDACDLERIAQLDSTRPPHGDVLVAELDGEMLAWIELDSGRTAADPFRRTAAPVLLLLLRAGQLGSAGRILDASSRWTPGASGTSTRDHTGGRERTEAERAGFWVWILALALGCVLLGAVLASVARAAT
jgi:hypothetical protein